MSSECVWGIVYIPSLFPNCDPIFLRVFELVIFKCRSLLLWICNLDIYNESQVRQLLCPCSSEDRATVS